MGLGSIDLSNPTGKVSRFVAGERIYELDANGEPVTLLYAAGARIASEEEAHALMEAGYSVTEEAPARVDAQEAAGDDAAESATEESDEPADGPQEAAGAADQEEGADVEAPETKDTPQPVKKGGGKKAADNA